MKRASLFWAAAFLLTIVWSANSYADLFGEDDYWIDSITITPPVPTETDTITIDISCSTDLVSCWGFVYLEHDPPSIDLINNDIVINLRLLEEDMDFGFDLDESVIVNSLPSGEYSVTVFLCDDPWGDPWFDAIDIESALFTVVPEPGTMLLLGLGGVVLRKRK